jgi:hypothetical protein
MSKYTDNLASIYEQAKERLAMESPSAELDHGLLSGIIVAIAVERPVRFGETNTLAEEALRRYRLAKD